MSNENGRCYEREQKTMKYTTIIMALEIAVCKVKKHHDRHARIRSYVRWRDHRSENVARITFTFIYNCYIFSSIAQHGSTLYLTECRFSPSHAITCIQSLAPSETTFRRPIHELYNLILGMNRLHCSLSLSIYLHLIARASDCFISCVHFSVLVLHRISQ